MATKVLEELASTHVSDGAGGEVEVRAGDHVVLIPPERRKYTKDRFAWMSQWLGEGPYTISRVCRNPHAGFIGAPLLIFRQSDNTETGAFASEFQKARPRRIHLQRGHYFF